MSIMFVVGLLSCSFSFTQETLPYHKDSVRNFVFTAVSGRVDARLKQRLLPTENFIILNGDNATLQFVELLNDGMGRNGIGGLTHTGPIRSLEITEESDYIEIYFILGAATIMISIRIKYWNDGEAIAYVEPMNAGSSIILDGYMYNANDVKTTEGANK